jgi:hypothetical protein
MAQYLTIESAVRTEGSKKLESGALERKSPHASSLCVIASQVLDRPLLKRMLLDAVLLLCACVCVWRACFFRVCSLALDQLFFLLFSARPLRA